MLMFGICIQGDPTYEQRPIALFAYPHQVEACLAQNFPGGEYEATRMQGRRFYKAANGTRLAIVEVVLTIPPQIIGEPKIFPQEVA